MLPRSNAARSVMTNEAVIPTRLAPTFCLKGRFPRTIRITDFQEIVKVLDHSVVLDSLKHVETY